MSANSAPPPARGTGAPPLRIRRSEAVFALGVILLAGALFAMLAAGASTAGGARPVATIARDGAVLETIDLSTVEKPYTLHFEDARGKNTVAVERGRIRVSESDCPDQICVDTGWIDAPGKPIACVPHGLTIVVTGEKKADGDALDATSH